MFLSLNDVKVAIPKELVTHPLQDDQRHSQMSLMIMQGLLLIRTSLKPNQLGNERD